MKYNLVLENKMGEAVYRYIYRDESGYISPIDVMKQNGVLIFDLDDVHIALGYENISKRIYSKLDKSYIFEKFIPGEDSVKGDYTDIMNLEIFIKHSRKPEAKKFLKWVKETIMPEADMLEERIKDHLKEVSKEDDDKEIDIEALTDAILSNNGVRKAIINVLKSKLK